MKPQNRLLELDALRGLAALAVVIFHYTHHFNSELGWRFSYGVTGVDIFFMISGFVIFLTILNVENWQQFVLFRLARLYPVFWICVTLTAGFVLLYQPDHFNLQQILANLTMFPAYFGMEDLDGSYWTLIIELLFYAWILLIYVTGNLKNIITVGVAFTIAIVLFHYFGRYYPELYRFVTVKIQLINHFPLFLSGIVFYSIHVKKFSTHYIFVILFCIWSAIYLSDKGGRTMFILRKEEHSVIILFYHLVFLLFVSGKLTFLKVSLLLFLGRISYCLYLLHQYIGQQLILAFKEHLALNIYVSIVLTLFISIGMAWLVNVNIEIPVVKMVKSRFKKQRYPLMQ